MNNVDGITEATNANAGKATQMNALTENAGIVADGDTTASVTLEDASKKYGAQAKAMIATYHEGQDVKQFDSAYRIAYDMGKNGVKPDYVMNSPAVSYLTESQRELAYETGKAAATVTEDMVTEQSKAYEGNVADAYVKGYKAASNVMPNLNLDRYTGAFENIYKSAAAGLSAERVQEKHSAHYKTLGKAAFDIAYRAGVSQREKSAPARELRGNAVEHTDSGKDTKEKRQAKKITGKIGKATGIRFSVVDLSLIHI